ncbi:TPA: hypothetical protein EYN09_09015 [Candidatus Poribacteria bacterium]|nr:hypothetical protein [Candidatus Poribacteria bacterium]HIO79214.1 hypothetical protein [Candidatus Poribacteria bacterium]
MRSMQPMYFIDQNYGWIGAEQGKILHTTDGGLTWGLQETSATNRPILPVSISSMQKRAGLLPRSAEMVAISYILSVVANIGRF